MWAEMNRLMGRGLDKSSVSLKSGGNLIVDKCAAECFNKYFVSVATELAKKFPTTNIPFDFSSPPISEAFIFEPVTSFEVSKLIISFSSKRSSIKEIQPCILSSIIGFVSPILTTLFNRCISRGLYPDCLKVAKVTPIFKAGDKSVCSNYRPISTLSIFNKLFEKIIHQRLLGFFEQKNVLSGVQFGFRKKSNTTLAIFNLVTDLLKSFKDKSYATCCFLDLKKAFDTVDRSLLLKKLDHYGIRNNELELVKSYLTCRYQYVVCGDGESKLLPIPIGVPQGSVLGPLLFNIYINDITELGTKCILFADDAVFYNINENMQSSIVIMQHFLYVLSSWLTKNRLTASETKTKLMMFTPCIKPVILPTVVFNGHPLEWVNDIKYLGITIDNKLRFNKQTSDLRITLSRVQGVIYSLRKFLPTRCLLMIYYSLAYSRVTQSIIIWGGTFENSIMPIKTILNKILRSILNVKVDTDHRPTMSVGRMYKLLNVLKFDDIYDYQLISFMKFIFDYHNDMYVSRYNHLIPRHNYSTRTTGLNLPVVRTEVEKHGPIFQSIRALNGLPDELMTLSCEGLKNRFKVRCLSRY